jgi:hypothetical protein
MIGIGFLRPTQMWASIDVLGTWWTHQFHPFLGDIVHRSIGPSMVSKTIWWHTWFGLHLAPIAIHCIRSCLHRPWSKLAGLPIYLLSILTVWLPLVKMDIPSHREHLP